MQVKHCNRAVQSHNIRVRMIITFTEDTKKFCLKAGRPFSTEDLTMYHENGWWLYGKQPCWRHLRMAAQENHGNISLLQFYSPYFCYIHFWDGDAICLKR
jgi:hypothetical protein